MALIQKENIERLDKERYNVHKPVQGTYTIFEKDGKKFFQLDTYGSVNRKMPEKISQSFQIDKETAIYFIDLLTKEFNL